MTSALHSQLSIVNSPLPPGYKQTEVGVIPEEWEVKPLKRISPRQSVGLVINPSTYFDKKGTVPLLVGSNVSENSIDATTANRITKASNEMLSASRLVAGDLVTVRVGEPGLTAVVPSELDGCNCASMMIVRRHPSFDSHWLCCAMNSQHGRRQIEHVQYGTAQKQFNISDAVDFSYPVPPLPEQRVIATALSDVDALLGALDRLIAKKRDLKQAAMQQLLTGQTRLPGFHGEWEVKTLPQFCQFRGGKAHEQYIAEFGRFVCVNSKFISTDGKERKYSTANFCCARKNDILMVMSDLPNGRALAKTFLVEQNDLYAVNQRVCALTAYHASPQFLSYILNRNPYFLKFDDGVSQTHLLNNVFLNCPLRIPPTVPEQTAIAAVLTEMDAELAVLEQRQAKTHALKQGMMQELLTGRTRLLSREAAKTAKGEKPQS